MSSEVGSLDGSRGAPSGVQSEPWISDPDQESRSGPSSTRVVGHDPGREVWAGVGHREPGASWSASIDADATPLGGYVRPASATAGASSTPRGR